MKNQIDYQTNEYKSTANSLSSIIIPLPYNSILKGVTVRKETLKSFGNLAAIQCRVSLIQDSSNSNIRLDHELLNGTLYSSEDGSNNLVYEKTLSGIYDFPIQKEGIALKVNIYNYTNNSNLIRVNYIVKNLEGGI